MSNTVGLRALRCAAGISQSELAQRAGISQALVGYLERGERTPSKDTLDALMGALGIDDPERLGYRVATREIVEPVA